MEAILTGALTDLWRSKTGFWYSGPKESGSAAPPTRASGSASSAAPAAAVRKCRRFISGSICESGRACTSGLLEVGGESSYTVTGVSYGETGGRGEECRRPRKIVR